MREFKIYENKGPRWIADSSDEGKFYWQARHAKTQRFIANGKTSSLAQAKRNLSNYIKRNQNAVYGNGSETPHG